MTKQDSRSLADYLETAEGIGDKKVLAAFRSTPRAAFVPESERSRAYEDVSINWRHESCASQPSIVARMLNQLCVEAGQSVLEIGTATGFNSALLSKLVGPRGTVTSVELDPMMVDVAQRNLDKLAISNVRVIAGDGLEAVPEHETFDRIIWTCATHEFPHDVVGQLVRNGKAVLPIVIRANVQRVAAFYVDGNTASSGRTLSARFVVQRGRQGSRTFYRLSATSTIYSDVPVPLVSIRRMWLPAYSYEATSVYASPLSVLRDLALWLAVHDAGFMALEAPRGSHRQPLEFRSGLKLPFRIGYGITRGAELAIIAMVETSTPSAPSELVVVQISGSSDLSDLLVGHIRHWEQDGRGRTDSLRLKSVPTIADDEDNAIALAGDVIINKPRSILGARYLESE